MTDFTSRHIAGFAEGFGLDTDHLSRIFDILNQTPGIIAGSIEAKLNEAGEVPSCGFTANLINSIPIDIEGVLRSIRETNQFNNVSGFDIEPNKLALAGLHLSPQQFTLTA